MGDGAEMCCVYFIGLPVDIGSDLVLLKLFRPMGRVWLSTGGVFS